MITNSQDQEQTLTKSCLYFEIQSNLLKSIYLWEENHWARKDASVFLSHTTCFKQGLGQESLKALKNLILF